MSASKKEECIWKQAWQKFEEITDVCLVFKPKK